jgi:glucose 1-dehydrogenase
MIELAGKKALVTGAAGGIGQGCAIELARCGADVVVNGRPGGTDLADTVRQIESLGRSATPIEANVFERAECEQLVAQAIEAVGRLDILVSNPAAGQRVPFLEFPPEEFERGIKGTLVAGFHIAQLVARHMVERGGGGKIIFISSVHAEVPYRLAAAYNAAKAGLNHLARSIAVELFQHRINVNSINPGWIDTPGERRDFTEEQIQREAAKLPWGRMGTPAEMGKAAAFLASNDADYITGTVLRADGGFVYKDAGPPA